MNQEVALKKSKKKLKIYYSLLITTLCLIATSYAFFTLYLRQSEDNKVTALSCFSTTLTEENSAINLSNEFPISDAEGLKKNPFTFKITNNCSKYVRTYITIDSLNEENNTYISSKYMKANISISGTISDQSILIGTQKTKLLDNNHNGYILLETGLEPNESKEYNLRLWIDYDTTAQQGANKKYQGQIVIVSEPDENAPDNWNSAPDGTLLAALRNDPLNKLKEPLTVPGREISAHTKDDISETSIMSIDDTYKNYYWTYGTDFSSNSILFNLTSTKVTSSVYKYSYTELIGKYIVSNEPSENSASTTTQINTNNLYRVFYVTNATENNLTYKEVTSNKKKNEALLASTKDDYGTSYYFRGAVKNNYVQFANKCWRIVRINGNGTIKIVLHNDNINNSANPCSSINNDKTAAFARYSKSAYTSKWNELYEDNAYIGLMYGTTNSSNYANTHTNINKNTVLNALESWYNTALLSYEDKLADTIWCNDKKVITTLSNGSTYGTGLGYGTNQTGYSAYNRISGSDSSLYASPSLICSNDNNNGKLSKMTVSDTLYGNGALTYKIGLLTADEVAFAGAKNNTDYTFANLGIYLQENTGSNYWWTMSPAYYRSGANIWSVNSGFIGTIRIDSVLGIRPSISLKQTVTATGNGTSEDPYIIK
ncbi:MAG: hypothetical protein Q4C33_01770 [bacterium]|nr:hypothetical protein [bacterium]